MRYTKLISTVFLAVSFFLIYGCSSQKGVFTNREEVSEPFQSEGYYSDTEYFRAVGTGTSPNLSMCKEIALTNAQEDLAEEIQTKVKSVAESYRQQRDIGGASEFDQRVQDLTRTVVNQKLNSASVFDRKTFQRDDGKYTHYVAIQMPVDPMKRSLENKISKDEKLRQDYDKKQFEETFEKEMKKMEDQQEAGMSQ